MVRLHKAPGLYRWWFPILRAVILGPVATPRQTLGAIAGMPLWAQRTPFRAGLQQEVLLGLSAHLPSELPTRQDTSCERQTARWECGSTSDQSSVIKHKLSLSSSEPWTKRLCRAVTRGRNQAKCKKVGEEDSRPVSAKVRRVQAGAPIQTGC